MPATWVKPKLICEVKFQEWTQEHIMRVPIFMGLRIDKRVTEVKKEKEMATQKIKNTKVKKQEEEVKKQNSSGSKKSTGRNKITG